MTYNVLGGTLSLPQSINQAWSGSVSIRPVEQWLTLPVGPCGLPKT